MGMAPCSKPGGRTSLLRLQYRGYNGDSWRDVTGGGNWMEKRKDTAWSQETLVITDPYLYSSGSAFQLRWSVGWGGSSFRYQHAGWYVDNVDISSQ